MRKSLFIFGFIFISILGSTQVTYFNKKFNIRNHDDFGMSIETIDTGYVIFGAAVHSTVLSQGFYLLFLDKNGDSLYSKWYGESNTLYAPCWGGGFRKYSKGGFYMGGAVEYGSGEQFGYLWMFDNNGDTLWTKKYGNGTDFYAFYYARETPDKGFILAGARDVGLNTQGLLIKTDSLGNVEWERNYGGGGTEYGTMVLPTMNGQYLLGGLSETSSCNFGGTDQWLVRTNTTGIQQWQKCYGTIDDEGNALPGYEFSNGDFAYVGQWAHVANRWYPYVSRINSSGNIVWTKKMGEYGTTGFLRNMIITTNEDILSVGQWSWASGIQGLLVRVSSNGDSLWYRKYDYDPSVFANDELWDIDTAHGGGYVMCGTTNQSSIQDVWVIKVDEHGCLNDPDCWLPGAYEEEKWSVGINEMEKENWFSVYPNPNNGRFFIENKIGIRSDLEIKIYNPIGEILFTTKFNTTKTEIDLTNFSNGIYFVEVRGEGVVWRGKIVKE